MTLKGRANRVRVIETRIEAKTPSLEEESVLLVLSLKAKVVRSQCIVSVIQSRTWLMSSTDDLVG